MRRRAMAAAVLFMSLAPLGCQVRVQRDQNRHPAEVDIETPVGDLSVRSDAGPEDVGLPIYPGARPLDDRDEHDNANVDVDSPFGGVRVATLTFESNARPDVVADFYRREMQVYGTVTVCRGNLDFDDAGGARPLRCRERRRQRHIEVAVGTQDEFHLASVKPRGDGSEFAVVYVRTSGRVRRS